jgi:hypothetical protein
MVDTSASSSSTDQPKCNKEAGREDGSASPAWPRHRAAHEPKLRSHCR